MAQKDQSSKEFKQTCAKIWKGIAPHTTLDSFRAVPRRHSQSIFLGYADITVGAMLATGVVVRTKLTGIGVKLLKGRPHIEVKSELGRDGKTYYPIYSPVGQDTGAEYRMVLTTFLFSQPQVTELVNNIEQRLAEAENRSASAGASDGAPFGDPADESAGTPFESDIPF